MKKINYLILIMLVFSIVAQTGVFAQPDDYYSEDYKFNDYDKSIIDDDSGLTRLNLPKTSLGVQSDELATAAGDYITEAEGLFKSIGIIDEEYIKDEGITRAQAAMIIANLMDSGNLTGTVFADVPTSHFANKHINYVYFSGIIPVKNGNLFEPDAPLDIESAAGAMVRMLGYGSLLQEEGKSALIEAQWLGVLRNVNVSGKRFMTQGALVAMIFNCLNIPMMEKTGIGEGVSIRSKKSGVTILLDKLNLIRKEGLVTGLDHMGIMGDVNTKDNEIDIMAVRYVLDETAVKPELGDNIVFYSNNNEEVKQNIVFTMKNPRVQPVVIKSDQVTKIEGRNIYYIAEENVSKLTLEEGAKVSKNGVLQTAFDESLLTEAGLLQFTKTGSDIDNYDIVIIKQMKSFIVSSVAADTIFFKYDIPLTLGGSEKPLLRLNSSMDYKYSLKREGKEIKTTDLKEWDVLSVILNKDGSAISVSADTASIQGTVEGVIQEGNTYYAMIDGKTFAVDSDYYTASIERKAQTVKIAAGVKGVFMLNPLGIICGVNAEEIREDEYGFVISVGSTEGAEKLCQLKVLIKDEFKVFSLKKRITFNGEETDDITVINVLKDIVDTHNSPITGTQAQIDTEVKRRRNEPPIIRFKRRGDDEIVSIVSRIIQFDRNNPSTHFPNDNAIVRYFDIGNRIWRPGNKKSFRGDIYVNSDTMVIQVPQSGRLESFKATGPEAFPNVDNLYFSVAAFDCDTFHSASLLMNYSGGSGVVDLGSPVMVVEKISRSVNIDNEEGYRISGIYNGAENSFVLSSDSGEETVETVEALVKGDIIQLSLDDLSQIIALNVCFKKGNEIGTISREGDKGEMVTGRIEAVNGKYVKIWTPSKSKVHLIPSRIAVLEKDRLISGVIGDLNKNDTIVLFATYDGAWQAVVYK